ncbi:MAG: hypothetical protein EXR99_04715 [Gemmataceae bacterium]|nr:hypothetical protein [Gemmataceae bacterium]
MEKVTRLPERLPDAVSTKEAAVRVAKVGRTILNGNPQIGIRPAFHVVGAPHAEVFHQGTEQVMITEGLVNQCSEDQLGAILAIELAKMLAERGPISLASARDRGAPINIPIGNDRSTVFGPPDGVRLVELAEQEKLRAQTGMPDGLPADPRIVAGGMLSRAGLNAGGIGSVGGLLKKVEENYQLEKQMKKPPAPASSVPGKVKDM